HPEPYPVDARQVDSLLHEVALDRGRPALAQLNVVVARADRIRIALQVHHQVRMLPDLGRDLGERRLVRVVELRLVEGERHDLTRYRLKRPAPLVARATARL